MPSIIILINEAQTNGHICRSWIIVLIMGGGVRWIFAILLPCKFNNFSFSGGRRGGGWDPPLDPRMAHYIPLSLTKKHCWVDGCWSYISWSLLGSVSRESVQGLCPSWSLTMLPTSLAKPFWSRGALMQDFRGPINKDHWSKQKSSSNTVIFLR